MQVLDEAPPRTIDRFITFRRAEGMAESSIARYVHILKDLAAFVYPNNFMSLTRPDLERYLADWAERESTKIKGKRVNKLGDGRTKKTSLAYMNFIRIVLKYFFKWLYQSEDYPECVRWIHTRKIHRELDPRDILTEEEIYKLIRGAFNARDKAFIHVLYESGARLNEIHQRNVEDVSFETIQSKGDAILTAQLFIPSRGRGIGKEKGKYLRLVDSAQALQAWLKEHPNPAPDQPLWVSLHSYFGTRWGRSSIPRMLQRVARQCGITKPVHPHAFRHAQVTASAKYLADQELKKKFGWTKGSQMLQIYSHLTDRAVDDKELEMRGIKPIEDTSKRILTHVKCDQCGRVYSAGKRICDCGRPLDPDLAARYDLKKQETEQSLYAFAQFVTGLPSKKREALLDFMKELKK